MDETTDAGRARPRRAPRPLRRFRTHAALGAGSVLGFGLAYRIVQSDDPLFRTSMATAYVALALFAATVSFGPIAELRGRRYPVSTDIRRDFGIWCAIAAMTHVVAGLQVHLRGKMWEYFVRPANGVLLPRIDVFGAANYAGLGATLMLVALLATSNDASLRSLGARRWQRVHRLSSWALVLTLLHGGAYQLIEKRGWAFVLVLDALAAGVLYLRIARGSEPGD